MNQRPSVRIMVVDDHPMTREGLCAVLSRVPEYSIVAEGNNGLEAVDLFRRHKPDVLLMDLSMPQMNGLQATRAIVDEFTDAQVVIFSASDGDETVYQAMRAGARAYLLKDSPSALLLETITPYTGRHDRHQTRTGSGRITVLQERSGAPTASLGSIL
jgi:two-component system NarL family response regulator